MVDELSGSKGSRDIANIQYFSESVNLDLILAVYVGLSLSDLASFSSGCDHICSAGVILMDNILPALHDIVSQ